MTSTPAKWLVSVVGRRWSGVLSFVAAATVLLGVAGIVQCALWPIRIDAREQTRACYRHWSIDSSWGLSLRIKGWQEYRDQYQYVFQEPWVAHVLPGRDIEGRRRHVFYEGVDLLPSVRWHREEDRGDTRFSAEAKLPYVPIVVLGLIAYRIARSFRARSHRGFAVQGLDHPGDIEPRKPDHGDVHQSPGPSMEFDGLEGERSADD